MCQGDLLNNIQRKKKNIFRAPLLLIVHTGSNSHDHPGKIWINKLWDSHTIEYHIAGKVNKPQLHTLKGKTKEASHIS